MTEPIHTVLAMLVIISVPTFVWSIHGPVDDSFNHMIAFLLLGIALFFPTVFALEGIIFGLHEYGLISGSAASFCNNPETETCVVDGTTFVSWIGLGVLVYIITYISGCSIHEIWSGYQNP